MQLLTAKLALLASGTATLEVDPCPACVADDEWRGYLEGYDAGVAESPKKPKPPRPNGEPG